MGTVFGAGTVGSMPFKAMLKKGLLSAGITTVTGSAVDYAINQDFDAMMQKIPMRAGYGFLMGTTMNIPAIKEMSYVMKGLIIGGSGFGYSVASDLVYNDGNVDLKKAFIGGLTSGVFGGLGSYIGSEILPVETPEIERTLVDILMLNQMKFGISLGVMDIYSGYKKTGLTNE